VRPEKSLLEGVVDTAVTLLDQDAVGDRREGAMG